MTKKFYCENCKCSTDHEREPTQHFGHIVTCIITLGYWVPIYAWRYFKKDWKCTQCDTVKK